MAGVLALEDVTCGVEMAAADGTLGRARLENLPQTADP